MSESKHCSVRIPESLHRLAKLKAYEAGMTLQSWIEKLIKESLEKKR
jgi:predicted HicB family RNase H-like nuclease